MAPLVFKREEGYSRADVPPKERETRGQVAFMWRHLGHSMFANPEDTSSTWLTLNGGTN